MSLNILITGGFGFIGGRLAVYLSQRGHSISLGTRSSAATPSWCKDASVVLINWEDSESLEQACHAIDVVIHAAGMNAQECAADPVAALAFNGVSTARLATAASRASVSRFIYLSTAHVYASPLVGTISEETCPRNLHPYATSHLAGENAVLEIAQRGKIESAVLRISNGYGAPTLIQANCWMLLVNDLCRQAVQLRQLKLRSGGRQLRDFISIGQISRVVADFAENDVGNIGNNVFNVGAGDSISVLQMTEIIQQRCGKVLGFTPQIQLNESARETAAPLQYRSEKLASRNLPTRAGVDLQEIDELLQFCQSRFGAVES